MGTVILLASSVSQKYPEFGPIPFNVLVYLEMNIKRFGVEGAAAPLSSW